MPPPGPVYGSSLSFASSSFCSSTWAGYCPTRRSLVVWPISTIVSPMAWTILPPCCCFSSLPPPPCGCFSSASAPPWTNSWNFSSDGGTCSLVSCCSLMINISPPSPYINEMSKTSDIHYIVDCCLKYGETNTYIQTPREACSWTESITLAIHSCFTCFIWFDWQPRFLS